MNDKKERQTTIKKLVVLCIVSAILSLALMTVFMGHVWDIANAKNHLRNLFNLRMETFLSRSNLLFLLLAFIGLHFIFPARKIYNWMFEKRWFLGIALLLFMTVNRYHGDSIGFYTELIQPNSVSETSIPILGETRAIRSDEFIATTPSVLASSYGDDAYSEYNSIMRGTETLNITNGVYLGYATLGYAPQELVYAILPLEYAFSFCWWFPIIFSFLMVLELFYIISNRKKLLSTAGASLVVFSSFYMWWGFSTYFIGGPGTIVGIYYFLQNKEKWKKVLYGAGTAICFSIFVTNLYPAWQVPLGYMFLAIGIWLLHDNWEKIKKLTKSEWIILFGVVVFMVSLILTYLYSISEYTGAITQTVYPGARVDSGSLHLAELFYCAQSPFYAYQDMTNSSEAGVFFGLFPIPTIVALYCWIKQKKKDWLTGGLLIAQIPMLIYVTVGFPEIVAKLTLFGNSTVERTCDIIGLMQIFFIVIILSRYEKKRKFSLKAAIPLGILTAGLNIYVSSRDYPEYLNLFQKILMFVVIFVLCVGLMVRLNRKQKSILCVSFIAISVFTSVYVRPLMKGLDAIYEKPATDVIQEICEENPDAKWLTGGGGVGLSAYSVACGASTINSVNTYPNLELWQELDPNSQYEDIYNRYAHVNVEFTNEETSFELIQADYMTMKLSYEDVEKVEAEYFLTMGGYVDTENSYVEFEKIYEEDGIAIYHMVY